MMSVREQVLQALHARLRTLPATALRGGELPERLPAGGVLLLRDGEPGQPEVTLSPLRYHYSHRAEIEAVVQAEGPDLAFDGLMRALGAALHGDRTLGGLCEWIEASAPEAIDLPTQGASAFRAALIPVMLHYSTADPLA